MEVKGPSKLRVASRAVFDGAGDSLTYSYAAMRKGARKATTYKHATRPAEKASLMGETGKRVGLSRIKDDRRPARHADLYLRAAEKRHDARLAALHAWTPTNSPAAPRRLP